MGAGVLAVRRNPRREPSEDECVFMMHNARLDYCDALQWFLHTRAPKETHVEIPGIGGGRHTVLTYQQPVQSSDTRVVFD